MLPVFQVTLSVILNIIGVAFAITAIVLYSANMADIYLWWMCENDSSWYDRTPPSPSREQAFLQEKCLRGKEMLLVRRRRGFLVCTAVTEPA